MIKKTLLKSWLLLLCMIVGVSSAWAEDADITYDVANWTVTDGALTDGTVSFNGSGSANFKMNSGYFMMGKSGAYINFPIYDKAVKKIVVTGNSGASASTVMNIYVGDVAVSTETTGSKGTNTYEIASDYQAAGTQYTLKVTSNHNAQITKIEVYFADSTDPTPQPVTVAAPVFNPEAGEVEAGTEVTISARVNEIYYTLDNTTPSKNSTRYTAPIVINEDVTIQAIAYDAEGNNSEVATAKYTVKKDTPEPQPVTGDYVSYDIAADSWVVEDGALTNGEISFSGQGPDNFKKNSGYFMMGKSGAYINFPIYDKAVAKIVVTGNSGASGSTIMNIYVGDEAVSTETTGSKETNTYEIASDYQAAGTQYTLKVTSGHNAQITKIEVYFVDSTDPTDPSVATKVTINATGITNTNVFAGTDAGVLTASVTANGTVIEGAVVTWSSNNEEVAKINERGVVTLVAAGTAVLEAKYAGVESQYKASSATYTLNVTNEDPNKPGTKDNPYTVAQAIAFINTLGTTTSDEVYVKGVVSQVDSYNSTYSSITYWISDDGTTDNQMQVYSGKGLEGAGFSSVDDLAVGDKVTVAGKVKMYNSTPEFDKNNYLVAYEQGKTDPSDPSLATNITIDDSGITNTDVFAGTDAGVLKASVVAANGNVLTDAVVTWSSSNEEVAKINESGAVTLVAAGTAVLKAEYAGVENQYKASSATYTLKVTNEDPNKPGTKDNPYTVAQAIAFIETLGTAVSSTEVYVKGIVSQFDKIYDGGLAQYWISDDGTTDNQMEVYKGKYLNGAEFTSDDQIAVGDKVVVKGNVKMYRTTPEFDQNNELVSLEKAVEKKDPELSFGEVNKFTVDIFKTFTAPALTTADGFDGTVTYASNKTEVAEVNAQTGAVIIKGVGTAEITAKSDATENFKAGSASYTITVTKNAGVDPVGPAAGGVFAKVTSTADIVDGQYLIVYEEGGVAFNGGLETLDVADNIINVAIEDGTIALTEETKAAVFTYDSKAGTLKSASGFNIGIVSYGNGLKQSDTDAYANKLSIDDDGNAVITIETEGGTMTLRYNAASNQNRFRYYKNGQQPIQLYLLQEGGEGGNTFDIAIGETGWRTLVTTVPAMLPEGLTAYMVTAVGEKATLTKVEPVLDNTPVLIKGNPGNYTLTAIEAEVAYDTSKNLLQISDDQTADGVFVLACKNDKVGFYKWTGGSLGAGRVYLPATASARDFIGFDFEETTGIVAVGRDSSRQTTVYNLSGQKVAAPQKGLYIVNGKKVIIK
jgi:hypothetical protein